MVKNEQKPLTPQEKKDAANKPLEIPGGSGGGSSDKVEYFDLSEFRKKVQPSDADKAAQQTATNTAATAQGITQMQQVLLDIRNQKRGYAVASPG